MLIKIIKQIIKRIYSLFAVILFLLLWEIAPRVGLADPIFIPPFSKVILAFIHLIATGEMFIDVAISLERAFIGFGISAIIAIPLGLLIGWFGRFEKFLDPLLQLFRQTSALSLLPVFILLFGIGEVSKVAIIFWGVQWPILLNTILGVKNSDPLLIKSARSMGASPFALFIKVLLPGAFPSIFTGIRLSATQAIVILVAAEMIGANSGLGFLIFESQVKVEIPTMYAAILTIAILGLIVNYSLLFIGKRITKWQEGIPTDR